MLRLLFLHLPKVFGLLIFALCAVVALDITGLHRPISDGLFRLTAWAIQPVVSDFQDQVTPAPGVSPATG